MTEPEQLASVSLIPTGHEGRLTGAGPEPVPVRVFERGRDTLMLVVLLDADTGLAPEPTEPLLLEYSSGQGLVRLHGQATVAERDLVRFVPEAPAEVLQRRDFVRVDVAQPVSLTDPGDGHSVAAHAIDVSGGGMLLNGQEGLREGQRLRFSLELDGEQPPVDGAARVVRTEATGAKALVFEAISAGDRQRLIHFIFDRQRLDRAKTRDRGRRLRRIR